MKKELVYITDKSHKCFRQIGSVLINEGKNQFLGNNHNFHSLQRNQFKKVEKRMLCCLNIGDVNETNIHIGYIGNNSLVQVRHSSLRNQFEQIKKMTGIVREISSISLTWPSKIEVIYSNGVKLFSYSFYFKAVI